MIPLSQKRDGLGFVEWILSDTESMNKWLINLCEAERQGTIKFSALIQAVEDIPDFPFWILPELKRMQQQEASHYALMKEVLAAQGLKEIRRESNKESVNEMFISEQRAVMRFTHIRKYDPFLIPDFVDEIAFSILPDEIYHVAILRELIAEKRWREIKV